MACCYYFGRGVEKSANEALKLANESRDKGSAYGFYALQAIDRELRAEAAEAERKAEEARKAAAATPARSIVHNGHVYKSLADHDPHSTTAIDEYNKFYKLDPPWELCPNTPDALHVCKTYPWAAYALVFADGSAHWTALAPSANSSLKAGAFTITHT